MMAERLARQQEQETVKHLNDVIVSLCFTIPILIITMIIPSYTAIRQILNMKVVLAGVNINGLLLLVLSSPVQWIVGYRFHRKAIHSIETRVFGMDFLISTGTSAAYLYSCIGFIRGIISGVARNHDTEYFETSAVLITVVAIGKYLETYAKGKTASAIHKLTNLRAKTARLVNDPVLIASGLQLGDNSGGNSQRELLRELHPSTSTATTTDLVIDAVLLQRKDFIRLVSGEAIPADGIISHGSVGVDESMMTGESHMISKRPGDKVFAGSTVVEGSSICYITACGDDSTLGKIVATVQDAQAAKPPIQEMADKVAQYFVPIVASISFLTFFVWVVGDINYFVHS